jgi:hypothetical protein
MTIMKQTSICKAVPLLQLVLLSATLIIAATIASPLSFSQQSALAQQAPFSKPIPIDNSAGDQVDSHIASSGDNVYTSYTSDVNGLDNILFRKSSDKGDTFSSPKTLSNPSGHFGFLSDIAASGDNVYVTWTDVTEKSAIVLAKSTDKGATFSDPVRISTSSDNARASAVAVSGDNVYVTWQDFSVSTSSNEPDIFFAASTDGGATFSTPINLSNTEGTLSKNPAIAAFGSNVYVVWADCETNGFNCKVLYVKSSNGGGSFSNSPVVLTAVDSVLPDIKAFEDKVYVVYDQKYPTNDGIVSDIFLLKSTDGGNTFASPINLSVNLAVGGTANPGSNNPNIGVSGDNVGITWEDRVAAPAPHWEVYFAGSTDAANTFNKPISITSSFGDKDSTLNDVTLSGRNVYSTWTLSEGLIFEANNFHVYFAAGTITPTEKLTPQEAIQKLIDTINNMDIAKATKTSLNGPLQNAIKLLTDKDPSNDADVCSKLNSFLEQVNSKEASKQLTSDEAADLRQQATAIQEDIGCSPSSLASSALSTPSSSSSAKVPETGKQGSELALPH